MQLAYRKVPPEKSTHSAMPAGEDSAGAVASAPNVAPAAAGEAAAKTSSARRTLARGQRAARRYVASPNATGACAGAGAWPLAAALQRGQKPTLPASGLSQRDTAITWRTPVQHHGRATSRPAQAGRRACDPSRPRALLCSARWSQASQGGRALCSTMASAMAPDSAVEPPTHAAPTANPSAAECTSRPTNARLAPSDLPCGERATLDRDTPRSCVSFGAWTPCSTINMIARVATLGVPTSEHNDTRRRNTTAGHYCFIFTQHNE
jgi:hypothetical protein